ncbi:outer membrane protein [Filimonas lacunae]|nr:outer membrane protein [Filimonas lacunae]
MAGQYTGVLAQNNTSPYSILGIGDLETGNLDRSAGMANTGISLSSGRFMYHANPASYAKLDDHFFAVEMTGRFKAVNYVSNTLTNSPGNSTDLQVAKLALAIKVKKWWGSSIGILPYSSSNYSLLGSKGVVNEPEYNMDAYYKGSGGLHKAYFANAFQITKNLSAGIEASYIFGSKQQVETLDASIITGSTIQTTSDQYMRNGMFKYGLQYNGKINDKWKLALGATASNKTYLKSTTYVSVVNGATTTTTDQITQKSHFDLPVSYGFGASLNYNRKLTIAADYQAQNWSDLKYRGLSYQLVNSDRYSVGIEYSSLKQVFTNAFYEKYYLQAGLFYGNSYLQMYSQQMKNYGATLGIGLNTKGYLSYQISAELGVNGTTKQNLIKQNYSMVNFTVMYRDFWFTKVKKYN